MKKSNPQIGKTNQDYGWYLVIFLVAIGARIVFLLFIDASIPFYKYPFFAEKLASGKDIGERLVDLSPFYLYFLTYLKKLFTINWDVVKFFQTFAGAINCLLLMATGALAFRKEVGLLAALLYAVYGNLIIIESTLEPTVFVLLFNLLAVYCLLLAQRNQRSAGYYIALAGLSAGFSIITKPNFLLFLPLAGVWLLFLLDTRQSHKTRALLCILFFGATALVITPITVRNYVRLHDFVLVTADAGKVFYHGNGKGASALEGVGLPDEGFAEEGGNEPDYAHVLFRKAASDITGKHLSPSESSKFWFRKTLEEIAGNPQAYMVRELKKFIYFFKDYEMHYIASAYQEYKESLHFPFIRYGIIVSLGLLGMGLSLREFKNRFLIYGIILLYLLSGLTFLVQSRYRIPAVPYLCLFSGFAAYRLREMISAKKYKSSGIAICLIGLFFGFSHFVYGNEILRTDRWQTATKIYYQMGALPRYQNGQYTDAISELNTCIAMAPNFSPAYNLRGKSYAIIGKQDLALADFETVMRLSPDIAEGFKNIGLLYLLRGERKPAKSYLLKAHALHPQDVKIKQTLEHLK